MIPSREEVKQKLAHASRKSREHADGICNEAIAVGLTLFDILSANESVEKPKPASETVTTHETPSLRVVNNAPSPLADLECKLEEATEASSELFDRIKVGISIPAGTLAAAWDAERSAAREYIEALRLEVATLAQMHRDDCKAWGELSAENHRLAERVKELSEALNTARLEGIQRGNRVDELEARCKELESASPSLPSRLRLQADLNALESKLKIAVEGLGSIKEKFTNSDAWSIANFALSKLSASNAQEAGDQDKSTPQADCTGPAARLVPDSPALPALAEARKRTDSYKNPEHRHLLDHVWLERRVADREIADLKDWKESAMFVIKKNDAILRPLADRMGVLVGEDIIDGVTKLEAHANRLVKELEFQKRQNQEQAKNMDSLMKKLSEMQKPGAA